METNSINFNLPKVVIGELGVVFLIDAQQRRLIQNATFPRNVIELETIHKFTDQYVLVYDREKHNHLNMPLREALISDDCEVILLPKELTDLAQTPSDEACARINLESRDHGFGFYLANQALNDRLMGKLPTIEIAGDNFYIDVRVGELRHVKDPLAIIRLDDIRPYEHEGKATFLYDAKTKSVFHLNGLDTALPENVSVVQTRAIDYLDPVGLARYYQHAEGYYLDRYDFQAEYKAAIVPLAETTFASYFDTGQDAGTNHLRPKR